MAATALAQKGKGCDEMVSALAKAGVAREWCDKVTELTGERWSLPKVHHSDIDRFRDLPFGKLMQAVWVSS